MIASIEHLTTVVSAPPSSFYQTSETESSNLYFHIILGCAAAAIADGREVSLQRYIAGFVRHSGGVLMAYGNAPGRVHLVVGLPLFVAPGNFVRELKLLSAAYAVRKLGAESFAWNAETDVFTVSDSQIERVAAYIFRQYLQTEPEPFASSWNRLASREIG